MDLILASSSPYRQALLARLGLPFTALAPAVDETPEPAEGPETLALRLALAKAQAVAAQHPEALVIGSDQVASLDGSCMGKPGTVANARAQLAASAGRTVQFFTGIAVVGGPAAVRLTALVPYAVTFRALTEQEITRYVAREPALDCAGAFKCEGLGISLFESMAGDDPTALEGLPLIASCRLLRQAGLQVP